MAWASHCDTGPYHGWVMAYNAATLAQVWAMATTANGSNGGIWQSGNGPVIDANGNIYYTVGNGTVNPANGQYGESAIHLTPSGQITDYFVPNNYSTLEGPTSKRVDQPAQSHHPGLGELLPHWGESSRVRAT